jgi:putative transposase
MSRAQQLAAVHGVAPTCAALGVSPASFHRAAFVGPPRPAAPRHTSRKLSDAENLRVLEVLNSERFMDRSARQIYAALLDEGVFLCSVRTMYRILERNDQLRERRDQKRHPAYQKPELLATGPNQVWSWDITKLKGPNAWTTYHLYVVLDLFSRLVVGWLVADHESSDLACELIEHCVAEQKVARNQLRVHADNGAAMRSRQLAELLAGLDVGRSFSRPHVSNDNPYSEAQFKTLKYHPGFPERFGSPEDARTWLASFFHHYNHHHHHSGLAYLTPHTVHTGTHHAVLAKRRATLAAACARHPERFVLKTPRLPSLPSEVWINQPMPQAA